MGVKATVAIFGVLAMIPHIVRATLTRFTMAA
jgi:hypothetical protein